MKCFFITGSTGYVGSQLALELANRGHKINALYRDQTKTDVLNHPNISLILLYGNEKYFKNPV